MDERINTTKEQLIIEAARLFAAHGFEAVSIKDIADAVHIKPSSLYNHFTSKEELLECVLKKFQDNYYIFLETQKADVEKQDSLKKVMDVLYTSLWTVDNSFMYYGMVLLLKEQFHNEQAKKLTCKLFFEDSLTYLQGYFDHLEDLHMAKPADSRALSIIFMLTVLNGTMLKVQKSMDPDFPVDANAIYRRMYDYMTDVLKMDDQ